MRERKRQQGLGMLDFVFTIVITLGALATTAALMADSAGKSSAIRAAQSVGEVARLVQRLSTDIDLPPVIASMDDVAGLTTLPEGIAFQGGRYVLADRPQIEIDLLTNTVAGGFGAHPLLAEARMAFFIRLIDRSPGGSGFGKSCVLFVEGVASGAAGYAAGENRRAGLVQGSRAIADTLCARATGFSNSAMGFVYAL